MTDLTAGLDELATTIGGLVYLDAPMRVATRLEDVRPPCVWIALDTIDHFSSIDEQTYRLFLIAGDIDEYRALKTLGPMLDLVLGVISPTEATVVASVATTIQTKPLPALRVTTSLT